MKKILLIVFVLIFAQCSIAQISLQTTELAPTAFKITPDKTTPLGDKDIYPNGISIDGKYGYVLGSGLAKKACEIYNLSDNSKLFETPKNFAPIYAGFDEKSENFLTVISPAIVNTYNMQTFKETSINIAITGKTITKVIVNSDFSKLAFTAAKDTNIYIVDIKTGNILKSYGNKRISTSALNGSFTNFAFASDDEIVIALTAADKKFKFVYDKQDFKYRKDLEKAYKKDESNVELKNKLIEFGEMASNLVIFNISTGKAEAIRNDSLNVITIAPKDVYIIENYLIASPLDKETQVYIKKGDTYELSSVPFINYTSPATEMKTGDEVTVLESGPDKAELQNPILITTDKKYLISGSGPVTNNNGINIWDLKTGIKVLFMTEDCRDQITGYNNIHISSDGKYLVAYFYCNDQTACGDNHISYWEIEKLLKNAKK